MRKALVFQRHSVLTFTTGSYDGVDMHPGSSYSGSRAAAAAPRRQPPPQMTPTASITSPAPTHVYAPLTPPLNTTPSRTESAGQGSTDNVTEQSSTTAAPVRDTMQDLAQERANTALVKKLVANARETLDEQAKAELERIVELEGSIRARIDGALSTPHPPQQHTHHTHTNTHDTHYGETLQGPKQGQMGVGLHTDGVPDRGGRDQVMSNGRHDGNDGADLGESEGVQRKTNGKQAGAPDIHH